LRNLLFFVGFERVWGCLEWAGSVFDGAVNLVRYFLLHVNRRDMASCFCGLGSVTTYIKGFLNSSFVAEYITLEVVNHTASKKIYPCQKRSASQRAFSK